MTGPSLLAVVEYRKKVQRKLQGRLQNTLPFPISLKLLWGLWRLCSVAEQICGRGHEKRRRAVARGEPPSLPAQADKNS